MRPENPNKTSQPNRQQPPLIRDGGTDLLDGVAAAAAAPVTEGASLIPGAGLFAAGRFNIFVGLGLSLDAVTRFTGQKPLFPLVDPLFNWG